jgi:purine-binding chemotaxis protein CheW
VSDLLLLQFRLDETDYTIASDLVEEVLPMLPIRQLPGAPFSVLGVCAVRGELLPVLDPRPRLGLPPWRPTADAHLLKVHAAGKRAVIVVDQAEDVVPAQAAEICRPGVVAPRVPYGMGVLRRGEKDLIVLDLEALVNQDDWSLAAEAMRRGH